MTNEYLAEIDELYERIAALEARIAALEARIAALEGPPSIPRQQCGVVLYHSAHFWAAPGIGFAACKGVPK